MAKSFLEQSRIVSCYRKLKGHRFHGQLGSIIEMSADLKGIALQGRTPGLTLPVSIDQPGATNSFGHGTFTFFLTFFSAIIYC